MHSCIVFSQYGPVEAVVIYQMLFLLSWRSGFQTIFSSLEGPTQGKDSVREAGGAPTLLMRQPEQISLISILEKKNLCQKEEILKTHGIGTVSSALGRKQHKAV